MKEALFVYLYIIGMGTVGIFKTPFFNNKLQIPEIIFIIASTTLLYRYFTQTKRRILVHFNIIDVSVLIFILIITAPTVAVNDLRSWIQYMGLMYLWIVMLYVKHYILNTNQPGSNLQMISHAFIHLGVLCSILALLGGILWCFGIDSILIQNRLSYLYFGSCIRLQAAAGDPNMLASLILISMFFTQYNLIASNRSKFKWAWLTQWVSFILTLSKTVLLSTILLLVKKTNRIKKTIVSSSIILLLMITHFFISTKPHLDPSINDGGSFVSLSPWVSVNGIYIYPTSYSINKYISIYAFLANPLTGIGLDMQEDYSCQMKKHGKYPENFSCLDSHCTYLAILAETGLFGFAAFIWLIWIIYKCCSILAYGKRFKSQKLEMFKNTIILVFLFILFEGLILESYTFRQNWVLLGVLSALYDLSLRKDLIQIGNA
ncbi:MAG: hypothetical protein KatS3mg031_3127 [Chitinophagales bacterium]|nr:MAG: hypothetical protein KatS3mg031_3127 [Chitinophagales bacterium]